MKKSYEFNTVSKTGIAWFWEPESNTPVEVKVIDSDFNKYVTMINLQTQEELWYKWCYVFPTKASCQEAIDGGEWKCINPWKMLLSKKDYSMWKKLRRKENKDTGYYVWVESEKFEFKFLKYALNKFRKLDDKSIKSAILGSNRHGWLFELEDGVLIEYELRRKRQLLKSRHTCKVDGYKELRK